MGPGFLAQVVVIAGTEAQLEPNLEGFWAKSDLANARIDRNAHFPREFWVTPGLGMTIQILCVAPLGTPEKCHVKIQVL